MLEAQFLAAALEAGRWLENLALETDDGLTWPVQVEGETRSGVDLYQSLVVLPDEPWRQLQERTRARGE